MSFEAEEGKTFLPVVSESDLSRFLSEARNVLAPEAEERWRRSLILGAVVLGQLQN